VPSLWKRKVLRSSTDMKFLQLTVAACALACALAQTYQQGLVQGGTLALAATAVGIGAIALVNQNNQNRNRNRFRGGGYAPGYGPGYYNRGYNGGYNNGGYNNGGYNNGGFNNGGYNNGGFNNGGYNNGGYYQQRRFRRDVSAAEEEQSFEKVLSRDKQMCGLRLVCELEARSAAGEQVGEYGQMIVDGLFNGHPTPVSEAELSTARGKYGYAAFIGSQSDVKACAEVYSSCKYSSKVILSLVRIVRQARDPRP